MSTRPRKTERGGSNQRITSGLVALSSAAIFAVYSAGYVRTRSASERVTLAAAERRPPPLSVALGSEEEVLARPAEARPAPESAPAAPAVVSPPAGGPIAVPTRAAAVAARPSAVPSQVPSIEVAPATSPNAQGVTVTATPAPVAPATQPGASSVPAAAVPAVTSASGTDAATAPAAAASIEPAPAAPAGPRYKDGTYSGWGSCRHGDIQATVVITGGRIVSATITQCLTRYPCSPWLTGLPAQVVRKQSPNVDYVSGASDSTDAFYGAVYDALFKAK